MSTSKQIKEEQKIALRQREIIAELQALVGDIERCEKSIVALKQELEQVNARHADRNTTQQDIAYLEDLLACAKRKLVWEKQMASLQKRTPELMARVEELVNHPQSKPDEETRGSLLQALRNVQDSMRRLSEARV
jgi:uncharacterized protein YoxC